MAALVLGSAACLWADVEAALSIGPFDGVVACNDAAAWWPGKLDVAVSLHPDFWRRWIAQRDGKGYPRPDRILAPLYAAEAKDQHVTGYVEHRFPGQTSAGSSGLFALKVALDHFDRAVLCGVPMEPTEAHFTDPKLWRGAVVHRTGWGEALPYIRGRARSMSGWTADKLGRPDPQFFD